MAEEIQFLEEEKLDSFRAKPETQPKFLQETPEIRVGDPQKCREGRESYYSYPILVRDQQVAQRRYSEFLWLKNTLNAKYPGCFTSALPEKEGVMAYWTNQDPSFYEFRRYGLEKFLERVSVNPRLRDSQDYKSFMNDDEITFQIRVKESQENKSWFGTFKEWSSTVGSTVSSYLYGENTQNSSDQSFSHQWNQLKALYQQQESLCNQGQEMVRCLDNEIQSNVSLNKAYENLSKVEKDEISEKLSFMAEIHQRIVEAQRESYSKVKNLVGQEMEDYRRFTLGALEAIERRNKIKLEASQGQLVETSSLDTDLRDNLEDFNQNKKFMGQQLGQKLIEFKHELSQQLSEIWRDAYNQVVE